MRPSLLSQAALLAAVALLLPGCSAEPGPESGADAGDVRDVGVAPRTDAGGTEADASAEAVPPGNAALPTVTGDARQGATLSGHPGSWSGTEPISTRFQWLRCDAAGEECAPIAEASSASLVLSGDEVGSTVRLGIVASNVAGSAEALSLPTAVVGPAPVPENTAPPSFAGSALIGEELTALPGTWTNDPTGFSYQWLRCTRAGDGCQEIEGATAERYAVVEADVLRTLAVRVSAHNAWGSAQARSATTSLVAPQSCPVGFTDSGPRSPTAASSVRGTPAWTAPAEAGAVDGKSATVAMVPGDASDYLVFRSFGLNLPATAAINGIEVRLTRRSESGAGLVDAEVELDFGGSGYPATPLAEVWGTQSKTAVYGGPTARWGKGVWRAAELNDPAFGLRLLVRHQGTAGADVAHVDGAQITVHYSGASSVGPAYATQVVDVGDVGTVAWSSPELAQDAGGGAATAVLPGKAQTHRLVATGFGLSLPAGKALTGVLVEVLRKGTSPAWLLNDQEVKLWRDGAVDGLNRVDSEEWTTTLVQKAYGGAADTWGLTLTAEDVGAPGFGVALTVRNWGGGTASTASVDSVRMTLLYDLTDRTAEGEAGAVEVTRLSVPWLSPEKALAPDGEFARASALSGAAVSDELQLSGFGFALPAGAAVHGIQLSVLREAANGSDTLRDRRVGLVHGGVPGEFNAARPEHWQPSLETVEYGGPLALWGRTWTASEINDAAFGASVSAVYDHVSGNDTPRVDSVAVSVYYCAP